MSLGCLLYLSLDVSSSLGCADELDHKHPDNQHDYQDGGEKRDASNKSLRVLNSSMMTEMSGWHIGLIIAAVVRRTQTIAMGGWCLRHELAVWSKSDRGIIDIAMLSIRPIFRRDGRIFIGVEIEPSLVVGYWPFSGL
jgi:hypothetical protein